MSGWPLWVMVWAALVPCPALDAEVEAIAKNGGDVLLRIAPFMGPRASGALLARANQGDALAVMAMGLSGQADALKILRERRFPKGTTLARSLALLALGDGTETATIARALESGDSGERARIATYLGALRTVRSRELLEAALADPEPQVRFEAARPLAKARHPRARRVLLELARSGPESLRGQAAALASTAPPPKLEDQLDDEDDDDAPSAPAAKKGTPAPDAGVPPVPVEQVARARLSGADGDALRAAIQLFGHTATPAGIDAMLVIARRADVSLETRGLALETALRLCPR